MKIWCPENDRRRVYILGICAFALLYCTTSAQAGVLDSWDSGRENANLISKVLSERIVKPGLDILKRSFEDDETLSSDTKNFLDTAKRKTDETAGRVIGNHIKTAANRMGFGKVAQLGSSIKEKVVDKAVEKVAGFVTDKTWSAAESAADRLASSQEKGESGTSSKSSAGESVESSESGNVTEAGKTDEDAPSVDVATAEVDPLIALDIHEDEQNWYRNKTDVLNGEPLPDVDVAATVAKNDGGAHVYGATETWAGAEKGDCESDWGNCSDKGYWNKELQEKASKIDPWAGYRKSKEQTRSDNEDVAEAPLKEATGDCEKNLGDCPDSEYWNSELQEKASKVDPWADYLPPEDQISDKVYQRAAVDQTRTSNSWVNESDSWDTYSNEGYSEALANLTNDGAGYESMVSTGGYQASLDRMEKEEADQRRREEEDRLRKEKEEAERKSRQAASTGYGSESKASGSVEDDSYNTGLWSDCDKGVPSVCEEAINTASMRQASLDAALRSASSISQQRALVAQIAQAALEAARICYSAERRPHCREMYQQGIRELEQTLRSAN